MITSFAMARGRGFETNRPKDILDDDVDDWSNRMTRKMAERIQKKVPVRVCASLFFLLVFGLLVFLMLVVWQLKELDPVITKMPNRLDCPQPIPPVSALSFNQQFLPEPTIERPYEYTLFVKNVTKDFRVASTLTVSCTAKFLANINGHNFVMKLYPYLGVRFTASYFEFITRKMNNHFLSEESALMLKNLKPVAGIIPGREVIVVPPRSALKLNDAPFVEIPSRFGNEECAYAVDQLFGFHRVPPAFFFPLHTSMLDEVIQPVVHKEFFRHCQINFTELKNSFTRSGLGSFYLSTAILFVDDINEILLGKFTNKVDKLFDVYHGRELGTRVMFDYLIGNVDRLNMNHFSIPSDHGDQVILYLDQNSLIYDVHFQKDYLRQVEKLMGSVCKFYSLPYENLKKAVESGTLTGDLVDTLMRLNIHVKPFFTTYGIRWQEFFENFPFVKGFSQRANMVLNMVEQCIERHGHDYVFCDEA